MKILKYILLILILLNIPTFSIANISSGLGSATSMLLLLCVIVFYFFEEKLRPVVPLVVLGLSYYMISSLSYTENTSEFLKDLIRYFIFILGIRKLASLTSKQEVCYILLIGAISIIINALFFSNAFGRYSGFYINPNKAGFVCIIGFALTFSIKQKGIKLAAQFLFAIAGLMTLSRSFILLFLLVNIISIIIDKKNIFTLISGVIALVLILSLSSIKLNTDRFNALKSIFSDNVDTTTITKETRDETWANYMEGIITNPVFGQGYKKLHGKPKGYYNNVDVGVHNSFLMIIGEAGIIPFIIVVVLYISMLIRSFMIFNQEPLYLIISILLLSYLMVSHNYFDNFLLLFMTVWLYDKIKSQNELLLNTV
ncbi:hypothetical protein C1T31_08530 [Hanstruepera neustonica]|uniref:O-antigen ligase-related domain-containing protein n=1 Tax=Hanstruepera neustonica TaxID=1445657 RepID=A0A2K1DYD6_9FLAO|nr:O-antigen ligase family protein [Hanstruepera neustonica]PNQ73031.1 hypothetical protein C1T31_08530 [Hanstruepera neustonica]